MKAPCNSKPLPLRLLSVMFVCLWNMNAVHADTTSIVPAPKTDPHYTKVGFFDLHVCTWPKRPLLFLIVFSTRQFNALTSIEVFDPDDKSLGMLDLNRFKVVTQKGKKEKRVFMKLMDVPKGAKDGWYYAHISTKGGKKYLAKDLVSIAPMELAKHSSPLNKAEGIPIPKSLKWKAIPGAKYYQVFLKDMWDDEKQIIPYTIVTKPEFKLPKNLLQNGGFYAWRIQGRDVNENVLLGDFNHGSLSDWSVFTTIDE